MWKGGKKNGSFISRLGLYFGEWWLGFLLLLTFWISVQRLCVLLSGKKQLTMTEWLPLECEHYLSQRRLRGSLSLYLEKCAENGRPIELLYSICWGSVRLWQSVKSFKKLQ